jgi:hypothetical protein
MGFMNIDRTISTQKPQLLTYFRNRGEESLEEISRNYSQKQFKQKASEVNRAIIETKNKLLLTISQKAKDENWTRIDLLNSILMVTYCSYISMIDLRNSVWEYDYMAFSRRIGELWEPFCKICFEYSLEKIELFIPPLFSDVKKIMTNEIETYIDKLTLSNSEKMELKKYYDKVWGMVTSGEIKLELDLHFIQNNQFYNIDFKSGFGSNEKGNTNRLLLVAAIYKNLEQNYNCCLFVRSKEEENNQYFRQLRDSSVWTAYCGDKAYDEINKFTGFNLKDWITKNIDWSSDLHPDTKLQFERNDLLKYLEW